MEIMKTVNKKHPLHGKIMAMLWLVLILAVTGCGRNTSENEAERTGTFFNTAISLKIYDEKAEALMDACFDMAEEMENIFSAQKEGSELYELNHRTEQTVTVSDDLAACLSAGLAFGELSEGAFDITILPVRNLWDFESGEGKVPDEKELEKALEAVDYTKVHIDGNVVSFDSEETMIDLGGIAKGYISGKMKAYLADEGCQSALINLGGNVSTLGTKPDGSQWTVGVQEPFSDRGELLETVEAENDECVISSGIYERYFEEDGVLYHHILDARTGYPVETQLNQVTLVGMEDMALDALSTICILEGREKAEEILKAYDPEIKALFTDTKNQIEWMD